MSRTVEYKFKTEQDLGFYILNAVCHDWIHDFNNYERMGKIVDYITELVRNSLSHSESPRVLTNIHGIKSQISVPVSGADPDHPFVLETSAAAAVREAEAEAAPSEPAAAPAPAAAAESETAAAAPESDPFLELEQLQGSGDLSANETLDLYKAQEAEYLSPPAAVEEPETTPVNVTSPLQSLVDNAILTLNNIKTTISRRVTRANTIKINILQNLESFIGEAQLLVISKLETLTRTRTSTGGKKNQEQKGGASAIDIISVDDISSAIYTIIEEINGTENLSENNKKNLRNIFELMNEVFINFTIPGISELEKFNNSIITDILSMFIVNKCETIDIKQEAILYLKNVIGVEAGVEKDEVAAGVAEDKIADKGKDNNLKFYSRNYAFPNRKLNLTNYPAQRQQGGGHFNQAIYKSISEDKRVQFNDKITQIKASALYRIYKNQQSIDAGTDFSSLYAAYTRFIDGVSDTIIKVIPEKLFEVSKREINRFKNDCDSFTERTRRERILSAIQKLVDSINRLIFDKIIYNYEDIKNKVSATEVKLSGETGRLTGPGRVAVQRISQLVAIKTLELTRYSSIPTPVHPDLERQIQIIKYIALHGTGYTSVDDNLIKYFKTTYSSERNKNFKSGDKANLFLIDNITKCDLKKVNVANPNCRVINNAIPDVEVGERNLRDSISKFVVCPTSSVCDGMGSFGDCSNPTAGKQEYYNMDFIISDGSESNFYEGSTVLKTKKVAVSINYGFKFNELELYNFLEINLTEKPIILQANYTFKGVINRIIQIWKSATTVTDINALWTMLEGTQYFLSILKLGSQKAVGDIFQEVNSTLANGGYSESTSVDIDRKTTFGLMGDRPSGVRVIKLLKDGSGLMPKVCGGYIGDSSLIYVSNDLLPSSTTSRRGGKTNKRSRNITKTHKRKKYIKKTIKKRRYANKKTKRY